MNVLINDDIQNHNTGNFLSQKKKERPKQLSNEKQVVSSLFFKEKKLTVVSNQNLNINDISGSQRILKTQKTVPEKYSPSLPVILATEPSGARFPYNI